MSDDPTLYEWAGARTAIERMIGCFYDRVERDDLLSPLFPGGVSGEHREHVTTWWCEVFGGPTGSPSGSAAIRPCWHTTVTWASRPSSGSGSRR